MNNILECSFKDYLKMDGLNWHTLDRFRQNPKRFAENPHEEVEETTAMRMGRQFHELVLQGEEVFHENNALWSPPVNPKTGESFGATTKKYLEAYSDFIESNSGKCPYSEDELGVYTKALAEIHRNPAVNETLRDYTEPECRSEMMFRGVLYDSVLIKGSIDRYDERVGIVDLKTTQRVDDYYIDYAVKKNGYLYQLAFYQMALTEVCGLDYTPDCYIVSVELGNEFRSALIKIRNEDIEFARKQVESWILDLLNCKKENHFPGPYDAVISGKYYFKDWEDLK